MAEADRSAEYPILPARVAMLSIVDTNGRFYFVPPPQDHSFATAVGKWDLLSVEPSDGKDPRMALIEHLWIEGISLSVDPARLGTSQTVKFYPERGQYRSTRRDFYAAIVPLDAVSRLTDAGLVPIPLYMLLRNPSLEYRSPAISRAIQAHMYRLQDPGSKRAFYMCSNEVPLSHEQGRRRVQVYLASGLL